MTITKHSMNHTPGPWKLETIEPVDMPGRLNYAVTTSRKDMEVMALTGIVGAGDDAESIANGNLIAVAPEMLAALEWFVRKQSYHDNGGDDGRELDTYEIAEKFMEKAESLIAKAKAGLA